MASFVYSELTETYFVLVVVLKNQAPNIIAATEIIKEKITWIHYECRIHYEVKLFLEGLK